jgi:hypothetical protein
VSGTIAAVHEDRDHQAWFHKRAWVNRLVQALHDGGVLDFASGEDVEVTQAAAWPVSRRLPGEALRAALLEPDVRPNPQGLKIRAAYITGLADLADLRLPHGLSFDFCAFEHPADWQGLTVANLHMTDCMIPALTLDEVHIDGTLDLAGLAATRVMANGAIIGADLKLTKATLTNEGDIALALDRAHVKGNADLTRLTATGQLWANGVIIGWQLDLTKAELTNNGGDALNLDGADVKGGAFLNSVAVTGAVRALSATFGGELNLQDAKLTNEDKIALNLDRAHVKGNADFTQLTATGQLWANGVIIGNQLNLTRAKLTNEDKTALNLDSADINGRVVLNSINVTGEVWALGATFGSDLFLESAELTNKGGDALSLDGANVKGGAFLNSVIATGTVRAPGATIGRKLDLTGAKLIGRKLDLADAKLTNKGGDALNLRSARIGRLVLIPAAVTGIIVLDSAQPAVLETPDIIMTVLSGSQLSASGWRLGDIRGKIRHDRHAAAEWLSRDNAKEFVPQPWHELANVYERNGQPADARWMRWEAAQGVTRTSPWWSKPIHWIYAALVGHGYYPLIAAVWLILAIAASGIIVATNAAVVTPTAANKAAWKTPPPAGQPAPPITGATSCDELQDRSTCLNPVLYAFDNALPGTLATGQAAQWTANGARGANAWIPYALGGLKIASWILVALLLAGVTGLLRKT